MILALIALLGCSEHDVCFGDCEPRPWAVGSYEGTTTLWVGDGDRAWRCDGEAWLFLFREREFLGNAWCVYAPYQDYPDYKIEIAGHFDGEIEGTDLVDATWDATWIPWEEPKEAELQLHGRVEDTHFEARFSLDGEDYSFSGGKLFLDSVFAEASGD